MLNSLKVLAIVTAREGSRRLPGKNTRPFLGKSLVTRAVETACASLYVDDVIISTNDSCAAEHAKLAGAKVPFLRPSSLSQDSSSQNDVLSHVFENYPGFDIFILLQPTSPLRTPEDINRSLELALKSPSFSCVSFVETRKHPLHLYSMSDSKLKKLISSKTTQQSQDLEKYFSPNGAIYVGSIDLFKKDLQFIREDTVPYIMGEESSLDIDTEFDFSVAEYLLRKKI
jgi:CMP-N,N'-diacetyllegionaminic acid synthase